MIANTPEAPEVAMEERVILVSPEDIEIGVEEKLAAHYQRLRHRALSVFLVRSDGAMLLQRRAAGKYHSPGRWSNACCSHPRPGESTPDAARRRLREELGMTCALVHATTFTYEADLGNGLWEHEVDHVFVGRHDGDPVPNAEEVDGWRWVHLHDLRAELSDVGDTFTVWFRPALAALLDSPEWRNTTRGHRRFRGTLPSLQPVGDT